MTSSSCHPSKDISITSLSFRFRFTIGRRTKTMRLLSFYIFITSSSIIFANLGWVGAKIFEPCALAKEMVEKHRFQQNDIADWICLIRHESEFNSSALGLRNSDGSKDHGLFQISDKYWCVEGQADGACGLDCRALRDDDIKDDSVCARRIHRVTKQRTGNGFDAWAAWTQHCRNQNVNSYISHCK